MLTTGTRRNRRAPHPSKLRPLNLNRRSQRRSTVKKRRHVPKERPTAHPREGQRLLDEHLLTGAVADQIQKQIFDANRLVLTLGLVDTCNAPAGLMSALNDRMSRDLVARFLPHMQ